jgi:hypothetical protein
MVVKASSFSTACLEGRLCENTLAIRQISRVKQEVEKQKYQKR